MRKLLFALLLVAAAIIPAHAQDSLGTCIQSTGENVLGA